MAAYYCVYRAFVHFEHWLSVLRALTLTKPAEFRALKVPGWRTANGQKMQCTTMDTTRPKRAPYWLRSGRGGALSAAFHFISKIMADEMTREQIRLRFAGVTIRFASVTSRQVVNLSVPFETALLSDGVHYRCKCTVLQCTVLQCTK